MMHMLLGPCRWERLPLLLVGTYLVLCWALAVVVDVLNLGGLGDRFYELTGFEGTWVALFRARAGQRLAVGDLQRELLHTAGERAVAVVVLAMNIAGCH